MTWIRSAATRAVVAAARSRGLEPGLLFDKARVAGLPEDAWATVPLTVHFAIIEASVRHFDDPGFVIDIAEHVPLEAYDVMGFAMRSAPDLGVAVEVARRYQPLYTASSVFEVDRDARGVHVWMHPSGPLPLVARCATESAISQMLHLSRLLAGVHLVPEYVGFRHAAPRSVTRHTKFYGITATWNAKLAAIRFSAEDSARSVKHADATLHAFLVRAAEAALAEHQPPSTFVDQVRRLASELLPSGELHIERMASRLGMTSRTLRRRLAEHDTSFLKLRDEMRCDLAKKYLAERALPIAQIAFLLDFADERAFRRSFQRWTGSSPSQARATPTRDAPPQ